MLEFLQILSFVISLPPLVAVKCLNYTHQKNPNNPSPFKIFIYLFLRKKEAGEDIVSKYSMEGKLLNYFICLAAYIAFVRQKILSGHIKRSLKMQALNTKCIAELLLLQTVLITFIAK